MFYQIVWLILDELLRECIFVIQLNVPLNTIDTKIERQNDALSNSLVLRIWNCQVYDILCFLIVTVYEHLGDDKDFKFHFKINMNIKNSPMHF